MLLLLLLLLRLFILVARHCFAASSIQPLRDYSLAADKRPGRLENQEVRRVSSQDDDVDGDGEADGRSWHMERTSRLHHVGSQLRGRHGQPVALPIPVLQRRRR